jgi:hypothetical protein
MQWCIHIAGAADLSDDLTLDRFAALQRGATLGSVVRRTVELIRQHFGSIQFARCAFGTEFCEHLLPPVESLAGAIQAAHARGLQFTFLTPYVSDAGICRLRQLFEVIPNGSEVVFGDWGVLNVLRREFPRLVPVQGRLLNKSLRDPRVMGVYGDTQAGSAAALATLDALRRSNLDCTSYTALLERLGVVGVEMDNLPQDAVYDSRLPLTVYLPFGFISTSRMCMAAGLHYRKADKFQPGAPCRHQCQTHLVEYTYTNSPFHNSDQKFHLKGNTYFYTHTGRMLESLFEQAAAGRVNRLVFQPQVPMLASC